jgi:septal ring factor EnvC (AmiA/AmiB activator)
MTMKKVLGVILIISAVAALILIGIFYPQWLKQGWIWIAGFAGALYAGARRVFRFLGSGSGLDEVEQKNDELRDDLDDIRKRIDTINKKLNAQRQRYEREISRLDHKLSKQQIAHRDTVRDLNQLREMSFDEYFESLPKERQRSFVKSLYRDLNFE